jgi:hypothetical protein
VVNVFSPVNVFTSANVVTITRTEATSQFLTADIRDYGTAVFYRYSARFTCFTRFTWY